MTEDQKQRIESYGRGCEMARRTAYEAMAKGDPDAVHLWVEVARMYSERAFRVAQA